MIDVPEALVSSTLRVVALMRIVMRVTDADSWTPRPLIQEHKFQDRVFLVAEDNGWIAWKPNPDFPPFKDEATRALIAEEYPDPEWGMIHALGTDEPAEYDLRRWWHRHHCTKDGADTSGEWEITESGLRAAMSFVLHLDTEDGQ